MAHAKLSPSAAVRWLNCPGSIRLCAGAPRKPSSKYANEGSAAHYLGEHCLHKGIPAVDRLGDVLHVEIDGKMQKHKVTADMVEAVQMYLDEIAEVRARLPGGAFEIEKEVRLDAWIPGGFGTSDHVAIQPMDRLVIHDYKHGAGVPVDAIGNTQMRIYAIGALGPDNLNMVETVEMVIVQPRAPHSDGPIRRDEMPADELLAWGREVLKPGAERTMDPRAIVCAGSWCRWCDANGVTCHEASKAAVQEMFGESTPPVALGPEKPTPPPVDSLTPEQMAKVYRISTEIFEPWLKAVRQAWQDYLQQHGPTAGYKLVAGRSSRKWRDEIQAELEAGDLLGNEAYEEPKLKSVAQVEKALKRAGLEKDQLAHLVEISRGVSVAPDTDKRPALPASVEQMFGEGESA